MAPRKKFQRVVAPDVRLKDVFPPGFDSVTSSSSVGSHYSLKPEQLYDSLINRYDPRTHVESIILKSAWYGKQTKSAKHEFLVIQVEDQAVEGLINYLVLDRNTGEKPRGSTGMFTQSHSSSATTSASDAFRVSYDGDVEKLLQECQLAPYKCLERLLFPSQSPMYLYELVTLAGLVSNHYPHYGAVDSSCYLFAGLVWDCMRNLNPDADYLGTYAASRGRFGWVRYTPHSSVTEDVWAAVQKKMPDVQVELRRQKVRWEKIQKALAEEPGLEV